MTATKIYYQNRRTGETTRDHSEAMEWHRAGDCVDIYRNSGEWATAWIF